MAADKTGCEQNKMKNFLQKKSVLVIIGFAAGFAACWFFAPNSNKASGLMPTQGNNPPAQKPKGVLAVISALAQGSATTK